MKQLAFLWWLLGKIADVWSFFRDLSPKRREAKRLEAERRAEEELYGKD